jgi:hypothetical protein
VLVGLCEIVLLYRPQKHFICYMNRRENQHVSNCARLWCALESLTGGKESPRNK